MCDLVHYDDQAAASRITQSTTLSERLLSADSGRRAGSDATPTPLTLIAAQEDNHIALMI